MMSRLHCYLRRGQRGYNLVEMMLALVVLGLILGGALVPLQQRLKEEKINSAEQHLQAAKDAVFAYALSHTTNKRSVDYYDGINYELPSARPYLPCPDIDNDGEEDRVAIPAGYLTTPVPAAVFATVGICMQQKGLLPWKTLGVKSLDPWGNRLTYRVDRKFANALTGFDEMFYADNQDYTAQMRASPVTPRLRVYTPYADRKDTGAVICSDLVNDATNGGCPKLDLSNLEAGIVTAVNLELGHRYITPYTAVDTATGGDTGIVNGAVFVIVSHGHDGQGAIGNSGKCHALPQLTSNIGEIANAYYGTGHPFLDPPFSCGAPGAVANILHENQFVATPISDISNTEVDAPDDLLVWGGSNELLGYLARNGMLPLKKLEYLTP